MSEVPHVETRLTPLPPTERKSSLLTTYWSESTIIVMIG